MMTPADRLASYLDALRPIIYINNFDFSAADALISEAVGIHSPAIEIEEYNHANGKVHFVTKMPQVSFDASLPVEKLKAFLAKQITDLPLQKVIVLKDIHNALAEPADPAVVSLLKAIALRTMREENYWVPVIIVASRLVVPPELEKFITVFDMPSPDRGEIEKILEQYAQSYEFEIPDDDKAELALAFKGLSEFEITQILNLAYQQSGCISRADKNLILKEKELSIRKTGLLEAVSVPQNVDIGGLENLDAYLEKKAYIYRNLVEAEREGVDIPRGILIVGMPGCGKSLTAKRTARKFDVPLLRLDVGKLLGKYVGESEENLRRAIQMAEAAAPCVLWIDEIEKAFAGVGKDDGSGVTTRLFGSFLTWMQEKESTVYVVATANDITSIPPEFLRKGRFDEMFSVGLPQAEERKQIFELHLKKRKPNWKSSDINLNILISETGGSGEPQFSGADIEAIVKTAVEEAFLDKHRLKEKNDAAWETRKLSQRDLLNAIRKTIPIAKTMAEKIKSLKDSLAKYQFVDASKKPES